MGGILHDQAIDRPPFDQMIDLPLSSRMICPVM